MQETSVKSLSMAEAHPGTLKKKLIIKIILLFNCFHFKSNV